ncbi:MAG: SprT family zinc-dependent metalloprotease [bacterium]
MELFKYHDIEYSVSKSNRRTASLFIERDGSVSLIVPKELTQAKIENIVKSKRNWIYKSLAEWNDLNSTKVRREFTSGEGILYLGRNYKLIASENLNTDITVGENYFILNTSQITNCYNILKSFYKERGSKKIATRVNLYKNKIGVSPRSIRIQNIGNRWGSCTKDGNLNFHWKIMMAPLSIIDYVVVHELVHLKYKTHNAKFWNEIDKVMPDYLKRKNWLRDHGAGLDL